MSIFTLCPLFSWNLAFFMQFRTYSNYYIYIKFIWVIYPLLNHKPSFINKKIRKIFISYAERCMISYDMIYIYYIYIWYVCIYNVFKKKYTKCMHKLHKRHTWFTDLHMIYLWYGPTTTTFWNLWLFLFFLPWLLSIPSAIYCWWWGYLVWHCFCNSFVVCFSSFTFNFVSWCIFLYNQWQNTDTRISCIFSLI